MKIVGEHSTKYWENMDLLSGKLRVVIYLPKCKGQINYSEALFTVSDFHLGDAISNEGNCFVFG